MRQDFYFRVNSGYEMTLSSLREDPELIRSFIKEFMINEGVAVSKHLARFYLKQSWPGNIRQLKSHLARKKVLRGNSFFRIEAEDLLLLEDKVVNKNEYDCKKLEEVKSNYVFSVYQRLNQDLSKAADVLGIAKNKVRTMLKKYEMGLSSKHII